MRLHCPNMAVLKPLNSYFDSIKTTIFSVMSALAMEHNAVNLGQVRSIHVLFSVIQASRDRSKNVFIWRWQGFPDDEGPVRPGLLTDHRVDYARPFHTFCQCLL